MKPKLKYSTTRISPPKLNSPAESQQEAKEVCHVYFMKLRSGLTIQKKACYVREKTTKRSSLKTGGNHKEHLVLDALRQQLTGESCALVIPKARRCTTAFDVPSFKESAASLSTYNDQSITFVLGNEGYEIHVDDLGKDHEKEKVLLRYYESQYPSSESGDGVDGFKLMVNLSPTKDIWLQANNEEHSVELQKYEKRLPDQAFFVLHKKPMKCVSFECKSNPGTFIGVKDNQLALIKVDYPENLCSENIMFKLSETM
ncbi:PREDICTED: interleukin-33 [Galeopterus variegatus]|uniref:Interleukin-33 n=1 Tax=Galeopterus variegatus TaxID=482537 RepID=A0ABM0R8V8_GALVR|nr:PREDICTED: interleukin-33 [Galeopterus variegatus]